MLRGARVLETARHVELDKDGRFEREFQKKKRKETNA